MRPAGITWGALAALLSMHGAPGSGNEAPVEEVPERLNPPVKAGPWIMPSSEAPAEPRWGLHQGLQAGLWPSGGPRGLIRIFAPFLGNPPGTVINFIAIEPVRGKTRWYSELEPSVLDEADGKRLWSSDGPAGAARPEVPWDPDRGETAKVREPGDWLRASELRVWFHVEPFDRGPQPALEVVFRKDRPHEVSFRLHAAPDSAPMDACILTATMGNYARLRELRLKGRTVTSHALWPDYREPHFAPAVVFPLEQLWRDRRGDVLVAAVPDEKTPAGAAYDPAVADWWRYRGKTATQYWRVPAASVTPKLRARVNGRRVYWQSTAPLPGGIAFENFEVELPFVDGQEVVFGVTPQTPAALGIR